MEIDKFLIKLNTCSAELEEPLDRELRTLLTMEVDIYSEDTPTNNDGTYNKVYRAKLNGSTIVKQGDKKPILAKSKRTASKKLRQALWAINPDEEYYDWFHSKLLANVEITADFLKDK